MDFQKNNRAKILIIGISSLATTLVLVTPNVNFWITQLGESDIGASQIINERMFGVGKNVSSFLILIPNEGHGSPDLPKEQRLINQPYVPENIVINVGTTILW